MTIRCGVTPPTPRRSGFLSTFCGRSGYPRSICPAHRVFESPFEYPIGTRPGRNAPSDSAEPDTRPDGVKISDLFKHPILIAAWISFGLTLFGVGAAIHFRNDMNMGELREPAHFVLWGAITFTLFARYFRKHARPPKSDS